MKAILQKTGTMVFAILLLITIISNTLMFIITAKLATSDGLFAKVEILNKYDVLQHLWLGAYALLLTAIILLVFLIFYFKDQYIPRKVYRLKNSD